MSAVLFQKRPEEDDPLIPGVYLWSVFGLIMVVVIGTVFWYGYYEPLGRSGSTPGLDTRSEETSHTLTLSLQNAPSLEKGHYALWVSDGITSTKVGAFHAKEDGTLVDLDGAEISKSTFVFTTRRDRNLARVFVTIEADDDRDNDPSDAELLTGAVEGDQADLAFSAVNIDAARGSYILLTPTDDPNKDFERSGLWFFTPENPFRTSLILNDAPGGWVYEAWVVHQGSTLSLGRFRSVAGRDSLHTYGGDVEGPAFPGEDFLRNAPEGFPGEFPLNLADGSSTVFVTLEPDTAGADPTGDTPFQLSVLTDDIPEGLADRIPEIFRGSPSISFPSGSATLK